MEFRTDIYSIPIRMCNMKRFTMNHDLCDICDGMTVSLVVVYKIYLISDT